MTKIYLSSTYSDLIEYRDAVYKVLRGMGYDAVAMEDYRATDERPLNKCLADVAACDLYIGIFAWRYGYIPTEDNPNCKSVTELEYRKACETDKECLIFLLDKTSAWPPTLMDAVTGEGKHGENINALRQELQKSKLVSFFKTPQELASLASQAVANWQQGNGDTTHTHELDRIKYLEYISQHFSSVKLPLDPTGGLSLQAIFQPLTLHRDPLIAVDLEREKHRIRLGERHSGEGEQHDTQEQRSQEGPHQHVIIAEHGNDALDKSQHRRIVILGGPGTGKTTTLKHFINDRAEKAKADSKAELPIYLLLPDFASSHKTLQSYLIDLIEGTETNSSYAKVLWQEITEGHAFLCLDGLDEVEPKERTRMIEFINTYATRSGNTWIVGSRFAEYKGGQFNSSQFTEWELQPLSHDLRIQLAQRLLQELQHKDKTTVLAEQFVNLLEHHEQAAAWGENPLLFSLAAAVYLKTGSLPSSRARLYREIIEAVLETRQPDATWRSILLKLLSAFSLWQHQSGGLTFSPEALVTFLVDIQGKSLGAETAKLVQDILWSGITETVAHNTYGFRHLTFQEYLAATELAHNLISPDLDTQQQAWNLAWSKHTYSRWTEVLRLMVGILVQSPEKKSHQQAYRWLKQLIEQHTTPQGDPGELALALALTTLREFSETPVGKSPQFAALVEEVLSAWLRELLHSAHSQRYAKKERLIELAGEISHLHMQFTQGIMNQLISALTDSEAFVRQTAIEALGNQGERIPLELFFSALYDADWGVRYTAIELLKARVKSIALDPVLILLHDKNSNVRRAAIEILEGQGERVPQETLLAMLHDNDEDVRELAVDLLGQQEKAAKAMGKQGEGIPTEPLLAMLYDRNRGVRRAVIKAVGEQMSPEQLLVMLHDEDEDIKQSVIEVLGIPPLRVRMETLLTFLQDKNAGVRESAVKAVGKLGEYTSTEPLLAMLHDTSPSVRRAVIEAVGGQISPEQLLEMLHDKNEGVRELAMKALDKQGKRIPTEYLLTFLQDKSEDIRKMVVKALEVQEKPIQFLLLLENSKNGDENVRCASVQILRTQRRFAPLLHEILQDANPNVQKSVMEALVEQGEQVPLNVLLALMRHENRTVQEASIEVLKAQGERIPLDMLLDLLHDEDRDVQEAGIEVLKAQGERIPSDILLSLLHDEDWSVQEASIEVLKAQGERIPSDILLSLLHDEDWSIQEASIEVLKAQGERIPSDILLSLLHDEDWSVQEASIEVLKKHKEYISVESILDLLYNEDANIRELAISVLEVQEEFTPFIQLTIEAIGDEDEKVRRTAIDVLQKKAQEVLIPIVDEAVTVLQGGSPGNVLGILAHGYMAETVGNMGLSSPVFLEEITKLLDWHHWQVRIKAAQALGSMRRNIPDMTIKRLLELRLADPVKAVREAADDALAEILSLETGIEDDEML